MVYFKYEIFSETRGDYNLLSPTLGVLYYTSALSATYIYIITYGGGNYVTTMKAVPREA